MKIIAAYLPQYHRIKENDEWWGDGFTEWTNVKKARSLFDGHNQPRVPLNQNYYNLLDNDNKTWHWQASLAKKYGVYGFSLYHYWFNGKLLLEKPIENLLKDSSIDIPFCICWANEKWTNGWVSNENRVLMEQDYSDEQDWVNHFMYLLPFFRDTRYIHVDNKPLIVIYVPYLMERYLESFIKCWRRLAQENGLDGLTLAFQHVRNFNDPTFDANIFDYGMEFQPDYMLFHKKNETNIVNNAKTVALNKLFKISSWLQKKYGIYIHRSRKDRSLITFSYDEMWNKILEKSPHDSNVFPGAFVDWDNTARKGKGGSVAIGTTPDKFRKYMTQQIFRARNVYQKDYLMLFAWNEWAESGYLEPDEKNGYAMLEALQSALIDNGEFPVYFERL